MRVGIAFDLKSACPPPAGTPDDLDEEFDTPATVAAIARTLQELGHETIELGNGRELLQKLLTHPPELVFNIAEGVGISRNRESRVPAVCEMLGIPCTGSDVTTLGICLDKDLARRTVQDANVLTPNGALIVLPQRVYDGDYAEFPALVEETGLQYPLIAKPNYEGSSKGIRSKCLIEKPEQVGPVLVSLAADYKQPVLLEEYIEGDEVTVGVVGHDPLRILGCMQIKPRQNPERFIYSLEVKRDWHDRVEYICPPKFSADLLNQLEETALAACDILGIRDIGRLDFRIRDGEIYFIEANPLPGLNPETGDICLITKAMGMTHAELFQEIIAATLARSR